MNILKKTIQLKYHFDRLEFRPVGHQAIVKEKPVEERLTQIVIHAHAIKVEKCHQAQSEAVKNISILVLDG